MGDNLLDNELINTLSIVYIVLLTPSVIGSFSVLVTSIVKWRRLKNQVHLLVQLTLADLLAALILMLTSVSNKIEANTDIMCQFSLPLSLTFYFISFLLVVVYAWKSKNAVQGWRDTAKDDDHRRSQCRRTMVAIPIYIIVWVVPLACYLAYVIAVRIGTSQLIPVTTRSPDMTTQNNNTSCNSCILFLHIWNNSCSVERTENKFVDKFIRIVLVIVVISVMIVCSFIYYKVEKWYEWRTHGGLFPIEGDGRSRRRFKRELSTARNMVFVILICWAPALLLILLSTLNLPDVKPHNLFALYLLQAATVSLQGFLNSMVYAWRRPNFTEAVLGESMPLLGYHHMAFFDESLVS
ncbi:transmembrane protein 116 [Nothobranchius furzeri]|uniref:LOC107388889-like protein n=1 Tax=Nothobranchius furzeri TaxID=105023 RepID=A0A8C6P625_NOTFU|nr:putative LOC107388889-like protein [Nothobranchius furzeri]